MNLIGTALGVALLLTSGRAEAAFDPSFTAYGRLLHRVVHGPRVDYQRLTADRAALDAVVASFDDPATRAEASWPPAQRLAFWINAYNVFTLQAIATHYPIRAGWFTLGPKNSIRRISGVWTKLTWHAAGRTLTLDDIEHDILRRVLKDPRMHFAINCASKSCPPIAADPYVAATLDAQLDTAARRYLGSAAGLQVVDGTLHVSSILNWYNDDFIPGFARLAPGGQTEGVRAVLGIVTTYGPPAAAEIARRAGAAVSYLPYDWSLNDLDRDPALRR